MLAAIKKIYKTPKFNRNKETKSEVKARRQSEKDFNREIILKFCTGEFKSSKEIFDSNILDLSKESINQHTLYLIKNDKLDYKYKRIDGTRYKLLKKKNEKL